VSWYSISDDGAELDVLVVPRASKNRVVGLHDGRVKIQLNAPPVDGAANAALVVLLAKQVGVKKSAVTIASGQTGRKKRVRIDGATEEALIALLP